MPKWVKLKAKIVWSGKRSGLTIFLIKQKIPCVGFWREIGLKIFKIRPFLLLHLNWAFLKEKIVRSGKRSGLTIFYISQKIPCAGFGREIGLKFFKIWLFLLIQLNWPKFTNFGHLFLKKMTNNWIHLQWLCNLLVIGYLLWAKWKKLICGHYSIFYVKVSPKNPLFGLCS